MLANNKGQPITEESIRLIQDVQQTSRCPAPGMQAVNLFTRMIIPDRDNLLHVYIYKSSLISVVSAIHNKDSNEISFSFHYTAKSYCSFPRGIHVVTL